MFWLNREDDDTLIGCLFCTVGMIDSGEWR